MTGPVTGPIAPTALQLSLGGERLAADVRGQADSQGQAKASGGDGGFADKQAGGQAAQGAPAVRLAAELLRLAPGTLLQALVGGPDEAGRPTLITSAGIFTPEGPVTLPPAGTAVTLEVTGSAELLSATLRVPGRDGGERPVELRFLGGPAPAGTESADRTLYRALQSLTEGGRQQEAQMVLRLGVAGTPAAQVLAATVVSRRQRPDGGVDLDLAAADGSLVTIEDGPPGLGTGARLMLEVLDRRPLGKAPAPPPPPPSLPSLAAAPDAIRQFALGRTALSAIAPLLAEAGDEAPGLAQLLPGLAQGKDQTMAVLLLSAALRSHDLRRLVGEAESRRIEQAEGPGPLLRAAAEFTDLARAAGGEPVPTGWRSVPLPFFDGRDIVPIVVFVQRQAPPPDDAGDENEQKKQRGAKGGSRFIVELTLSELGPLQIDGFAQGARIDTVLRSRRALPVETRDALAARYAEVLAAAGLSGALGFQLQQGAPGLPHLGQPAPPTRGGGISITA